MILQSSYLTENDLKDFGFKSIGKNVRISSDARIYGACNISIGNNVRIDDFVIISAQTGFVEIHDNVFIARSCHISGYYGVILRDFSSMAANTVVYSASDDYSGNFLTAQAIPQEYTSHIGGLVDIGKHVIIGAGCVIIGKCCIGEGCSIGSMSLVKNDIEPWGIYFGIPVRRWKDRSKRMLQLEERLSNKSR